MELSNRLKAVADMISAGNIACDAGCDHGYVSIYLIQKNICPRVIAMDVNEGPLAQAREHINAFGLGEYIETRLSDGVMALSVGEADSLILAGMGGRLVIKILTEGKEKISAMKELILQPQSEIDTVRAYLPRIGYKISEEDMVYEDGKYYPMMKAMRVSECDDDTEAGDMAASSQLLSVKSDIVQTAYDRYGELLLQKKHPVLYQFLLWEQKRDAAVLSALEQENVQETQRGQIRRKELEEAEKIRNYALRFFDKERDCAL